MNCVVADGKAFSMDHPSVRTPGMPAAGLAARVTSASSWNGFSQNRLRRSKAHSGTDFDFDKAR